MGNEIIAASFVKIARRQFPFMDEVARNCTISRLSKAIMVIAVFRQYSS
jgi:hypothetical protein